MQALVGFTHVAKLGNGSFDRSGITRPRYEDGLLTKQENEFLRDWALPDLAHNLKGNVIIKQPSRGTWEEMTQIIEMEDKEKPLDGALIDYLALADVSDSRNPIATINELIKMYKRFCLTFHAGAGLCGITPVQGKREGYEEAKGNGGQWQSNGAYMYSEFEKSCDKLAYIYTDDGLKEANSAKVGVCKSRRTIDAAPTIVSREPLSGRILDSDNATKTVAAPKAKQPGEVREDWPTFY